jgi:Pyridoxamine 5'-phosphate oxidase
MTDEPPEPLDEGAPSDHVREAGTEAPEQAEPGADRRAFLRQLSGDAVWTAGRLAGASAVIRRSLLTAGETAVRSLEEAAATSPPQSTPAGNTAEGRAWVGPVAPVVSATEIAGPSTSRSVAAPLTPAQHAFLEAATTAALAVNDPAGPPQLTTSTYLWDGETIHLPAQEFTARVGHIDRDPRVSVLIEDPATESWVAMTGLASLIHGDRVEAMMLAILGKYLSPDAAEERWHDLRATGDRIVIEVRPTRFVWRPA